MGGLGYVLTRHLEPRFLTPQGDRLGRLSISKEALAERDGQTLQACKDYGVPVAVVMAGGYAANIEDTVEIHHTTVRLAGGLAGIQI